VATSGLAPQPLQPKRGPEAERPGVGRRRAHGDGALDFDDGRSAGRARLRGWPSTTVLRPLGTTTCTWPCRWCGRTAPEPRSGTTGSRCRRCAKNSRSATGSPSSTPVPPGRSQERPGPKTKRPSAWALRSRTGSGWGAWCEGPAASSRDEGAGPTFVDVALASPADRGRAYRSPFWAVFNQAMAPARTSIWNREIVTPTPNSAARSSRNGPTPASSISAVAGHVHPGPPQQVPAVDLVVERVELSVGRSLGCPVELALKLSDLVEGGNSRRGTHRPFPSADQAWTKQRPFAPAGLCCPAHRHYYGLLRLPLGTGPLPGDSTGYRAGGSGDIPQSPGRGGPPQFPSPPSRRSAPSTPAGSSTLHSRLFASSVAFTQWDRARLPLHTFTRRQASLDAADRRVARPQGPLVIPLRRRPLDRRRGSATRLPGDYPDRTRTGWR
jgi:hypothetical protein